MPIPLIAPQLVEGISEMLWEFGFRHHPELQTRWIDGAAGLGMVARFSEKRPADDFNDMAEEFLAANNPELLEAVRNSSPDEKKKLLKKLEKNFEEISGLISVLKES